MNQYQTDLIYRRTIDNASSTRIEKMSLAPRLTIGRKSAEQFYKTKYVVVLTANGDNGTG